MCCRFSNTQFHFTSNVSYIYIYIKLANFNTTLYMYVYLNTNIIHFCVNEYRNEIG